MYSEFGYVLSENFKRIIRNEKKYTVKGQKEVYLFDKLLESFEQMTASGFDVDVIKDRLHQVYTAFDVDDRFCNGVINPKKREISDLVLIVYSPKKNVAKITFMQSKHELNLTRVNFNYFSAEIIQFYLLKYRPIIISSKNEILDYNKSVLNSAKNPSITSYNVFYNDVVNKTYDMAYYSSHLLEMDHPFKETKKRITRKAMFKGVMNRVDLKYTLGNLEGTNNLRCFGNFMYNFKIGEVIDLKMKEIITSYIPSVPDNFKEMEISDSNRMNDIGGIPPNFTNSSFVFINCDETHK